MLLALTKGRPTTVAALICAGLTCLPTTALAGSTGHNPPHDDSFLCDLFDMFCVSDQPPDPDRTPAVPEPGVVDGHRSADPEKSFPTAVPRPPPPAPPSPTPPPSPPSPKP